MVSECNRIVFFFAEKSHVRVVASVSLSEELVDDRVEQGHVFGTLDGQLVDGVVPHHLRYGGERVAELAKDEATLARRNYLHVHEATGTPARKKICIFLIPPVERFC